MHTSRRDGMRDLALASDRAPRGRSRSAVEARKLWQALRSGNLALLDQFDADGRRYLIARWATIARADGEALSQREREILGYAAMGYANKLIASRLGLAQSTVSTHIASAVKKLGVRSRTEAVARFAAVLGR